MATKSRSVLRRILAVDVLAVGTLALSGMSGHPLGFGVDIGGGYPSATTAIGIGACAACGLALVAAGAALWGWSRRYRVFGVALTISGGVGTLALLLYALEWALCVVPAWHSDVADIVEKGKPLLVSVFTGPMILLLGVLLLREQSKRDRQARYCEHIVGGAEGEGKTTMSSLQEAADKTKLQLAWFVLVYWYAHTKKAEIDQFTLLLRQGQVKPGGAEHLLRVFRRAIAIIDEAERERGQPREENPGHYLNKSAIVYLASLVERFVKTVHEITCPKSKTWMFGARLHEIGDLLPEFYDATETKRVRLLVALRNNIIHDFGKVSAKLRSEARELADDWPEQPWCDFDRAQPEEAEIMLDISKIGLPGLEYCLDFVDLTVGRVADWEST